MFNIGQQLYEIRIVPHKDHKKVTMIDQNGVEWFRWEGPRFKHKIVTNEVIGVTVSSLTGRAAADSEPEHRGASIVHLQPDDGVSSWCYELDLTKYLSQKAFWFYDLESAELKMKTLRDH